MIFKVKVKLNPKVEIEAEFQADNLQDAIRQGQPLLDFEGKCTMNDSEDISIRTRTSKEGFHFTEYYDKKDGFRRRWGAYRDGSGFFVKGDWEEPFVPQDQNNG